MKDKEKLMADLYNFIKEGMCEYSNQFVTASKERWKNTGRLDIFTQLLHFLHHYDEE